MKLFSHFSVVEFSNTYLLGMDTGIDAILIDPSVMDIQLLSLIEDHNYYIKSILVTHSHESHIKGVKTILKIYDSAIYGKNCTVLDFPCNQLHDGDCMDISGFRVEVLEIPGHSSDSLVFKIEGMLFTGDVLYAGRVGGTQSLYERRILLSAIREKLFTLPDDSIIFPGHGPPTTLKAEKMFNPAFFEEENQQNNSRS
ncbi:MAG: hypothetical protein DRP87_12600 [Spirochaetes bacterium]|nr:MAG: hypothetical protein DRP87_12600 [Spirochaetota bacterium]